jgi:hypothetical protein
LTVTTVVAEHPATVYEIVAVPVEKPVTTPPAPTLATDGVALLHVPPPVELLKVVVDPVQTLATPVLFVVGLTVTLITVLAVVTPSDI